MSDDAVSKAWDRLPSAVDHGDFTMERSPEIAALRALFGQSAFRLLGNAGIGRFDDGQLEAVDALQKYIAERYLYAVEAAAAVDEQDS